MAGTVTRSGEDVDGSEAAPLTGERTVYVGERRWPGVSILNVSVGRQ